MNFQKVLEGYEDGFQKLKENNTELEEYEKTFNAGIFDKYNIINIPSLEKKEIDIQINEKNIQNNLELFFKMPSEAAKDLIDFYEYLYRNNNISQKDISKYFWGIQAGIGRRYDATAFMIVNGNYSEYNDEFKKRYEQLFNFLDTEEKETPVVGTIDYQHMCATMAADANWGGEQNVPIVPNIANWGMGDGGDKVSSLNNPGNFGESDKNADNLANSLQHEENSSAGFMNVLSSDSEEVLKQMQKDKNKGS